MFMTSPIDTGKPLSRRSFLSLAGIAGAGLASTILLGGCSSGSSSSSSSSAATAGGTDYSNWDAVLEAAKGQKVSWYGYGGSKPRNKWLKDVLVPRMKKQYGIDLDIVGMDINDILTQLSGEKQAGTEEGSIDFIWINGENFYSAKKNGYLWAPFCDYLPNYQNYIDADNKENTYDFGSPTEGYEAPYGRAQMQMWVDSSKIKSMPKTTDEFLSFCKKHKGQVTYPEPSDFTGTAFICCLIANVVGKDAFEQLSTMTEETATEDAVKAIIDPGLEYLRSLNPYLWQQGKTFPSTSEKVSSMYADGELVLNMGYGAPQSEVNDGSLPKTTKSFLFDGGTVGNTNFMAISFNAPHKEGALVTINEVISAEMQLSQYEQLGNLTVLDLDKLDEKDQKAFDDVKLGSAMIPQKTLLANRITEPSGPAIPVIEKIWHSEVPGK
jgi:putative spermidine/putrescine transport system substrate-binding protein